MKFKLIGKIINIETIAVGQSIRGIARLKNVWRQSLEKVKRERDGAAS
jgi:hypothetical protein